MTIRIASVFLMLQVGTVFGGGGVCPVGETPCCENSGSCGCSDSMSCTNGGGKFVTTCDDCIPPGIDGWTTKCDGKSWHDFCQTPIPADFFAIGSEPFDGLVELGGPVNGQEDTQIHRSQTVALNNQTGMTEIHLHDLNLKGCQPISVIINGQKTTWDVVVTEILDVPQAGSMTITKTHANGGTFTSTLPVRVRFSFTCVGGPCPPKVPTELDGNVVNLGSVTPIPWVHSATGLDPSLAKGTNFVAGINGNPVPDCLAQGAPASVCCVEIAHSGPQHRHVVLRNCTICDCGACCDRQDGSCEFYVVGTPGSAKIRCENDGGEFLGSGSSCLDTDGDGIPNWFETNDCCRVGGGNLHDTLTDPENADTDGDGISDGAELQVGSDPCSVAVPAISEWGLAALTILVLAAGTIVLRRRVARGAV